MKRAAWLVVVAACGRAPARAPIANVAGGPSDACPAADRVVALRWMVDDVKPGWRAFLANRALDEGDATYQVIAAADAKRPLPRTVWVYRGDRPPCRATVTRPFREVTTEGPVSEQIGVELDGCAPDDPQQVQISYGLVGDEDLASCQWAPVKTVALRVGETADRWKPPRTSTPIPDELAARIAQRACVAPACERLWQVGGAGAFAYDVVQTWLTIADVDPCSLQYENDSDIFVRTRAGLVKLPAIEGAGNMALAGVFHDGGGARLVVLEDAGTFEVVAAGAALTPAAPTVWYAANEETDNYRSLAPYCGP